MRAVLPISAVVPTRNRSRVLAAMLGSLAQQAFQPDELILVDASTDNKTEELQRSLIGGLSTTIRHYRAAVTGAAVQRNQAVAYAAHENILFLDDDIIFEGDCIARLWHALQSDHLIGGVNATIINQQYRSPGRVSKTLFRLLHGHSETTYAGKCIGPALNLLPEDRPGLPETVAVEWLNTTCTLYRKEALPKPPFLNHFVGYSFMEDVALSLTVGKKWKLANARTARIYHDSQSSEHKNDQSAMAKMELINRHFIMTQILGRTSVVDHLKLGLLEAFGTTTSLRSAKAWRALPSVLIGKARGVMAIIRSPRRKIDAATLAENGKRLASN
jgi:glycosyltransferase involved in cell wall biosynthesis